MKIKLLTLLLLFYTLILTTNTTAEEDIHTVLGRLEAKAVQVNSMESNFVQTKKLVMFDKPLILKGKIFLKKPGQFAWHQSEHISYSLVIKGTFVRQWDGETGRVQEISVIDNPEEKNGDTTRLKFTETKLNTDIKPAALEAKPYAD